MAGKKVNGKKRTVRMMILGVAVVGLALVAWKWDKVMMLYYGSTKTINTTEKQIAVDNRLSIEEIAAFFKKEQLIDDTESFLYIANLKGLTSKTLEAGMYAVPAKTSYRDLCNAMLSGSMEVEVVVTFNNCKTIHDLAVKVSENLMIDSTELEQFILADATLNKYDFTVETIPALFLPNSYRMYYDTDKEQFVERMAEEFKKFWTADRLAKLKEVGLKSPSQAVTLASIVYGEQSKNASEWPIIAGLYLNRVRTGMKLQSDPTFKFCWGDQLEGVQRLTYEHRAKDCPYNTYLYAGLPPGPISMPPTGVIDAVLNPDKNNYLYMCAQPNYDGLHNFTHDYAVHARNAKEFQNWLAAQQ